MISRSLTDMEAPQKSVTVTRPVDGAAAAILTPAALAFLADLERRFGSRRRELLARRKARQARLDAGTERLDFLAETAPVRAGDWTVPPAPADLAFRMIEITGPTDRKMVINALNSGADCFMADFEDSQTPGWDNQIAGQVNMIDAVRRAITFTDPANGKHYALADKIAVLLVRPRGWHLEEAHLLVDGQRMSGSIFDAALYLFHNAAELLKRGSGPYFYLPKMESHLEAKLWHDVFAAAEEALGLPKGSVRATVLIETLPAAFEMDEILHALGPYATGLNCGRWDYIFSMIKTLGKRADFIVPDRAQVTMTSPALRAYSQLLIKTCHRRGAHAMGGMAAQIPVKGDPAVNDAAFARVKADKEREANDGHDGTWVAHPGLVPVAREAFGAVMTGANQLGRMREDVAVTAADLTTRPEGRTTEAGLRGNIRVAVQYLESWIGGMGCVPLYNLMEDAATAEICRVQLWQWRHHGVSLDTGKTVTGELIGTLAAEEMEGLHKSLGAARFESGHFKPALEIFLEMCLAEELAPFLTIPAYERLLTTE